MTENGEGRTEDDVSIVEPAGDDSGDEELRAVGVVSSVGHGQKTWLRVCSFEILVCSKLAFMRLRAEAG